MSIQTELTRLTNAKAAIQAAIEGKGVTVPSGTLMDGMAALIDAIEAGGGGLIAFSTITPSESVLNLTFEHNLGVRPNFIFWASNIKYNAYTKAHMVGFFIDNQDKDLSWMYIVYKWNNSTSPQNQISIGNSAGNLTYNSSGYGIISYDETSITFGSKWTNTVNFIAGKDVAVITGVI